MSCLAAIIALTVVEALEFGFSWALIFAASKAFNFDYNIWHVVLVWVAFSGLSGLFGKAKKKDD